MAARYYDYSKKDFYYTYTDDGSAVSNKFSSQLAKLIQDEINKGATMEHLIELEQVLMTSLSTTFAHQRMKNAFKE